MITELDFTILNYVAEYFRCEVLDLVMPAVSFLGENGWLWILLALILLIKKETRPVGAAVAVALLLDLILCNGMLKPLVGRQRPFAAMPDVMLIVSPPTDASFPSGHTAASFAAAAALYFAGKKHWGFMAGAVATLIGLSRIYLYVHYPSDVAAGVILGILCGAIGANAIKCIRKKSKKDENEIDSSFFGGTG